MVAPNKLVPKKRAATTLLEIDKILKNQLKEATTWIHKWPF
jgi:hypothetical protein